MPLPTQERAWCVAACVLAGRQRQGRYCRHSASAQMRLTMRQHCLVPGPGKVLSRYALGLLPGGSRGY